VLGEDGNHYLVDGVANTINCSKHCLGKRQECVGRTPAARCPQVLVNARSAEATVAQAAADALTRVVAQAKSVAKANELKAFTGEKNKIGIEALIARLREASGTMTAAVKPLEEVLEKQRSRLAAEVDKIPDRDDQRERLSKVGVRAQPRSVRHLCSHLAPPRKPRTPTTSLYYALSTN